MNDPRVRLSNPGAVDRAPKRVTQPIYVRLEHHTELLEKMPRDSQRRSSMLTVGLAMMMLAPLSFSQTIATDPRAVTEMPSTSTDLFVMFGSDFNRPGLLPRANYSIGVGHTFDFLKKNPVGDELIADYTYENSGSHGFLHTDFGEHTRIRWNHEEFCHSENEDTGRIHVVTEWHHQLLGEYACLESTRQQRLHRPDDSRQPPLLPMDPGEFQQGGHGPWYTTTSVAYVYSR